MQSTSNPTPNRISLPASLFGLLLALLTACSSPATVKNSERYSKTEARIAMEADPFIQPDRQEKVFGEDLWALSVLPVLITIQNVSDSPVRIEVRNFKLTLPGKQVIAPRTAAEVTKWLASQGNMLGQAGMGLGQVGLSQIGQFAGPIGGIAVAIISGLYGAYKTNASRTHDETFSQGEFKDATLGKDQFSRGIVFFMLPVGTPAFNEATLNLSIVENQVVTSSIELQLKALDYKGTASK
ncbi:MAG: hypothetical protein NTX45_01135 [Proteobacteria bacterium]|nr:hypothetical protein [Pseudomonadota bacterium]